MIIDLFAGCNTLHNEDNNLIQETRRVITELNNAQLLFNEITAPIITIFFIKLPPLFYNI